MRETVTSTMLGTMQYNATLMPLRGFKMTSTRFVTCYRKIVLIGFLFLTPPFFSHIEQASDKEIKLYRRKKQNLHWIISVLCAGCQNQLS